MSVTVTENHQQQQRRKVMFSSEIANEVADSIEQENLFEDPSAADIFALAIYVSSDDNRNESE